MSEGKKFDSGKPPLDLIPSTALIEEAKVMGIGRDKYGAYNWSQGMNWSRLIAALLRHALAYKEGQTLDEESGLSHMAHVRCCAGFLLHFEKFHRELDDRPNFLSTDERNTPND